MKTSICVIHVYWGVLPDWFNLFIHSCEHNEDVDFMIFSDSISPNEYHENVRFISLTMDEFNTLATEKLKLEIEIKHPYKVCDFKPAFGRIFENYLREYDFWGYCDSDLLLGKISNFITKDMLSKYSIISTYSGFLSGPFALFRNTNDIVNLFTYTDFYKKVYSEFIECIGFDENIPRKQNEGFSILKMLAFLKYLLKKGAVQEWFERPLEFRYQFQWFYKQSQVRKTDEPMDMSEILWNAIGQHKVKGFFKELLFSDKYYQRIAKKEWQIIWSQGKLFESSIGKELFGFHFVESKNDPDFCVHGRLSKNNSFSLTHKGIRIL